ncbi:MAG: HIT domain-containing protein [Chloroflexota bacterium]
MPDDCLFCGIDQGKPAAPKIYEDDVVYAIDVPEGSPYHRAPVHFMVIPHKHVKSALEFTDEDAAIGGRLFTIAARLAREKGIAESGFRLATNSGPHANQTVFHFHLHCLGGRQLGHEG